MNKSEERLLAHLYKCSQQRVGVQFSVSFLNIHEVFKTNFEDLDSSFNYLKENDYIRVHGIEEIYDYEIEITSKGADLSRMLSTISGRIEICLNKIIKNPISYIVAGLVTNILTWCLTYYTSRC